MYLQPWGWQFLKLVVSESAAWQLHDQSVQVSHLNCYGGNVQNVDVHGPEFSASCPTLCGSLASVWIQVHPHSVCNHIEDYVDLQASKKQALSGFLYHVVLKDDTSAYTCMSFCHPKDGGSIFLWNGDVCVWFYSVKSHETCHLSIQVAFWAGCFSHQLLNIITLLCYFYSVFPYSSFNFYLIPLNPPFLKIFINTPTLSVKKFWRPHAHNQASVKWFPWIDIIVVCKYCGLGYDTSCSLVGRYHCFGT